MKKQLILAALSAALLSAPYAEAASGFSRSSSSSSSSSKSVSAPKSSTPSYKPSESKRDYGSYSGFGSSSKKADTPKRETPSYSYNPAPAPQPKPADPYRYAPRAADSAAAPAPAPAKSGFGSEAKSNTGKKIAGVAAATALGGALYAAGANHEAVAAYEAKQKAAEAPAVTDSATAHATTSTKPDTSTTTAQAKVQPATSYQPQAQAHQSQPQVIVVQEAPRYRHDSRDDAYWYQRGRDSAQREQQYQGVSRDYGQMNQPAPGVARAQTTQPVAPAVAAAPASGGPGIGFFLVIGFVILLVFGVLAYAALRSGDIAKAKQAKPVAKKANYTL
ncbi:hypothetical protein WJ96_05890 [Burkholderia ubonensis]|uniref:Uncharacterized protein n=1 Tax=Burkholderia ubonensis TaxID=101571 RepID=A0AAW3MYM8_9BURK|nr:hypothetical protein [Burkholderia ubonensis]KVP75287.1 hypothetical protein WJ93_07685 [Burkholderia ubonensis]KVP98100.1 hypothetical protein WJ96_05890 [Burkholderia ubonensis]KVZ92797.1 hypothetical protein WL25_17550 [Burkholderia ubonensis]